MARVLIVDDDPTDRLWLQSILEKTGHELYLASNGKDALTLCLSTSIDVVVTDLHMDPGHGLELISALTALDRDVPVVVVSSTGPQQLEMAQMIGARVTLEKPIAPQELIDAVAEVIPAD